LVLSPDKTQRKKTGEEEEEGPGQGTPLSRQEAGIEKKKEIKKRTSRVG
jgi:hypothetical protein